ncbi:hypothetical protein PanWU01x14_023240 [Parasponia andersonii]|uniref:Uncharacterized protein n=1 Tax=Parasponia andersonii TaxID=3476 RepID=A0A2P5DXG9_PARAD|nr:hypothetical protein PanWU01x14_023240 [Parasponia andersonii]
MVSHVVSRHGRRPNGSHRIVVVAIVDVVWQSPIDGMATAATWGGDIVVVLSFVGGDHCSKIMGSSLYVLSHWTSGICALVVAPKPRNEQVRNEVRLENN